LNSGVAAILKAAALAAMTCMSGPPCWPGNTADWNFFANSSVPARIMPPRGPASVLCVVEVTTCASGTGFGCRPGGDEPAEVRHVDQEERADLVAIERKAAKSSCLE
jgi:hypothetical protein